MKRLFAIVSCLFMILAGAASVWASCKVEFPQRKSPNAAHAHHHHSDFDHRHDKGTAIHCPTLDGFLPTARISTTRIDRIEPLRLAALDAARSEIGPSVLYRSLHGPPGCSPFSNTPSYLSLSALRI
jgi:hypothetical protein